MTQDTSDLSCIDREAMRAAAIDPKLISTREQLARFTSETFATVGELLHVSGHIIGADRVERRSLFGHGK